MFKKKKQEEPKKDIRYALLPDYIFAPTGTSIEGLDIDRIAIFGVEEVEFITQTPNIHFDKSIIIVNGDKKEISNYLIFKKKQDAETACKYMNRGTIESIGSRLNNVENKINKLFIGLKDILK